MIIQNNYELGEIVYLKTDPQQQPRQIVGIHVTIDGGLLYKCVAGLEVDLHFEVEFSREKDIVLATSY